MRAVGPGDPDALQHGLKLRTVPALAGGDQHRQRFWCCSQARCAAYIGIDNRAAGAAAAYLITQWLSRRPGAVLVMLSSSFFRGEEEREMGFRAALRTVHPARRIIDVTDTDGLDATIGGLVRVALEREAAVPAVYSIGGGNTAILGAFAETGRPPPLFIAHDLDADNRRLLRGG